MTVNAFRNPRRWRPPFGNAGTAAMAVAVAAFALAGMADGDRGSTFAAAPPALPGLLAAVGEPNLTPLQKTELDTLRNQLADPARDAKTKREAALLLLTRAYPQAAATLKELLSDAANRPAQVAIAESIADSGIVHDDYVKPLLVMLTGTEPAVRAPAAAALATYKDADVLNELTAPLANRKTDRAIRLVIIAAMPRVLDKKAVDVLVGLLADADEDIRNAACDALVKLTSISAFGRDVSRWRSWWSANKDKPRAVWLADLADNLAHVNLDLEKENQELRKRLASATNDLYTATPQAGRDQFLAELLKDPLAEVRLAACRLTSQRVTAPNAAPVPEPLRAAVLARLADALPAIRREAALLAPAIGDEQSGKLLLERLKAEQSGDVREALCQALGSLRDVQAWEPLVSAIEREDAKIATAAASALVRLAEKEPPTEARKSAAAAGLKKRYSAAPAADSAALRESLLSVMGVLGDRSLADIMTSALKDPAPTIRLGAIKGLASLRMNESASAIAGLCGDGDRGVRLAAITAIGAMGSAEHLETVLTRTDTRVEPDATVRQQAWAVVMGLLEKAEPDKLRSLADQLAHREDAAEQQVQVLKLWAAKVPAENADLWVPVHLRLGETLLAASRPAEAAGELANVHTAMAKTRPAEAQQVWAKWVTALLASDEVAAVAKIAENADETQLPAAKAALTKRVEALRLKKDADSLVRLLSATLDKLGAKLEPAERQTFTDLLAEAQAQQRQADRQRVNELVGRLSSADETARTTAAKDLAAMKNRAVGPLLAELKEVLSAATTDATAEKAILDVLASLSVDTKAYNPKSPAAGRLAVLEKLAKQYP